ncbi:MAG: S8 family peptidase [Chloroflexi bacterium]|nr:S8 family peptidase [Chloroflexota bacterium]
MKGIKRTLLVFLALLLVQAFGAAGIAGADSNDDVPGRLHPAVRVFAEQHPGEQVPVIVQSRGDLTLIEDSLRAAGGRHVQRLEIIDGFAAWVTFEQAQELARPPDVAWVSLNAVTVPTHRPGEAFDYSRLATVYPAAANAVPAWAEGLTGKGVTVAVIDSGISPSPDFGQRAGRNFDFSSLSNAVVDENGHGTFVAGIIAGDGEEYIGIAPHARLLGLKVSGREGYALVSDVIFALQWVVDHGGEYGIRVVNLSLVSTVADSYRLDPLDAAVEQAWFHGTVVVAAAGNFGDGEFAVDHAPANDPYVITVGAFDDRGTQPFADDALASWSSRGETVDGFAKPEVVAPGAGITATLAGGSDFARNLREYTADGRYIRLSGTSASAAVVSGTVALMLEDEPNLTPDQVKFRLVHSGSALGGSGAPRVDAYAAVSSTADGEANKNAVPSDLIDPETGEIVEDSVLWRSVLWRSVLWRSVLDGSRFLEGSVLWRR